MRIKVSIILPSYNGAQRISKAIQSVIDQSYTEWELLVIDDGSKDMTREVVAKFADKDERIQYVANESNLGIQKTLNRGLREARGIYIARIDDDDEWIDSDKLQKQVYFLETHRDHVLVGTGVILVDEDQREIMRYFVPEYDDDIRHMLLGKNCFIHSSVLFKKDMALARNGYSELADERHIEDYDLWLKLGTIGKVANLPLYGVRFMVRNESLSGQNKIEQYMKILRLIKKYRNFYPRYFVAVVRSYARLIVYGFLDLVPLGFSLAFLKKMYQKYW